VICLFGFSVNVNEPDVRFWETFCPKAERSGVCGAFF